MSDLHKSVDVFQIEKSGERKYLTTINARGEENLRHYLEKQGIRALFVPVYSEAEKAAMATLKEKVQQPAAQTQPQANQQTKAWT